MCTLESPEKHLYPYDHVSKSSHSGLHLPITSLRPRGLHCAPWLRKPLTGVGSTEAGIVSLSADPPARRGWSSPDPTAYLLLVPVRLGGCQSDCRRQRRKTAASTQSSKGTAHRMKKRTNQPTKAAQRPPRSIGKTLSLGTATDLDEREVVNLCLHPPKPPR